MIESFKSLQEANKNVKTTNIKGKEYAEVNQRIKAFRLLCPSGSIQTDLVTLQDGFVLMRASILDEDGHVLGTGHAYEREGSTNINKTSYIENCETSAVGRALAMCGIGIDTSVASYEEVSNAIEAQEPIGKGPKATALEGLAKELNVNINALLQKYKKTAIEELDFTEWNKIMGQLKAEEQKRKKEAKA